MPDANLLFLLSALLSRTNCLRGQNEAFIGHRWLYVRVDTRLYRTVCTVATHAYVRQRP